MAAPASTMPRMIVGSLMRFMSVRSVCRELRARSEGRRCASIRHALCLAPTLIYATRLHYAQTSLAVDGKFSMKRRSPVCVCTEACSMVLPIAAVLVSFHATPARGQQVPAAVLDPVVVTATRNAQRAFDLPI